MQRGARIYKLKLGYYGGDAHLKKIGFCFAYCVNLFIIIFLINIILLS